MYSSISRDSTTLLCHQTLQWSFCLSFLLGLQINLWTWKPALNPSLTAGGLTSHWLQAMPPCQSCLLALASPNSESQKAILEAHEETPTFGNRLLPN